MTYPHFKGPTKNRGNLYLKNPWMSLDITVWIFKTVVAGLLYKRTLAEVLPTNSLKNSTQNAQNVIEGSMTLGSMSPAASADHQERHSVM